MYDLNICACEFSIRVCYGCTRPAYYLWPHLPDTAKPDLSRSLDLTIAGIFGPAFKSNFPDTHHTTSILFCIYLIKIGSWKIIIASRNTEVQLVWIIYCTNICSKRNGHALFNWMYCCIKLLYQLIFIVLHEWRQTSSPPMWMGF